MDLGINIATSVFEQLEMIDNYIGLLEDIDSITVNEQDIYAWQAFKSKDYGVFSIHLEREINNKSQKSS